MPQSLELKSPKFYVPIHEDNFYVDIQIIKLEGILNDIDPVLLPKNENDFYFIMFQSIFYSSSARFRQLFVEKYRFRLARVRI